MAIGCVHCESESSDTVQPERLAIGTARHRRSGYYRRSPGSASVLSIPRTTVPSGSDTDCKLAGVCPTRYLMRHRLQRCGDLCRERLSCVATARTREDVARLAVFLCSWYCGGTGTPSGLWLRLNDNRFNIPELPAHKLHVLGNCPYRKPAKNSFTLLVPRYRRAQGFKLGSASDHDTCNSLRVFVAKPGSFPFLSMRHPEFVS